MNARYLTNDDARQARELYVRGATVGELCQRYRVGKPKIRAALSGVLLGPNRASSKRAEASRTRWAAMTDTQRAAQVRDAHMSGAQISKGNKRRWARMTRAERDATVAAAHAATRGSKHSREFRISIANAIERRARMTPLERRVRLACAQRGLKLTPQVAVGPYNCDLGAYPIAVEVFGGHHHTFGRQLARLPRRLREFLDREWRVVMLVIDDHRRIHLADDTVRDFIAWAKHIRPQPPAPGEYRVIRGTGEILAEGGREFDEATLILAIRHSLDRRRRPDTR